MTPERAREIAESIHAAQGWGGEYTPHERAEIVGVWNTLPGWTCFFDAVQHIANPPEDGRYNGLRAARIRAVMAGLTSTEKGAEPAPASA